MVGLHADVLAHMTACVRCRYNAAVTETKSILNQSQKRVRAANGLLASTMRPPSATHVAVDEAAPPQPFGMPFAPRVPHVTSARALRSGRQ